MIRHPPRRVQREDTNFAAGRVAVVQYAVLGVFVFLLSGFWELQVHRPDYYSEAAERNRIKSQPVLAPRGKILDRDGRVIVDNRSSFSLLLSRENLRFEHLAPIAEGLGLEYDELAAKLKRYDRTRPKYEAMVIKEELSASDLAFVESHRDTGTFPEMELTNSHRRLYPQGGLAAHVIGYVSEVSEAELNTAEFARYKPGDVVGKAGIERMYNDLLMGVDGQRQVQVDNMGRERLVLGVKEATPGRTLQLTIDLDLQVVAELAMEGRRGAVVALDPRNGEVLAMVSRPAFDPNKFAGRIRSRDWKEITSNPDNPLLNRAIQAQLAPGSTFKPIVALAGLETGVLEPGFGVSCGGGASFYGRYFKCHLKHGHGRTELRKGLAQSCDVFFYTLGNRLGIDRIAQYAGLAGFGQKTGIDLPHEAEGTVPSTKWKIRNFRQKWYAGETISVAIGQGALTVTPLQLAYAMGGLATGGVWQRPHLLREQMYTPTKNVTPPAPARKADLTVENLIQVIDGLYAVVNEGGTGGRARLVGVEVCGKTGTAQLASNEALKNTKLGLALKDNAWFFGFAPRQSPEIVVAALFEAGEHGNLAAPIVRDVIKAYFDKKSRQTPRPPLLAQAPAPTPGPGGEAPE
ncbi:MAG: penicillin-binding protein 2 [Bryobacterales bacterium]|nr:penicillin-binding protein 2 [Bryobacterales bacterium]